MMNQGVLRGLADWSDVCRKHWPTFTVAGGVVALCVGHCIVQHLKREQVQSKIRQRRLRSVEDLQRIQEQINAEKVDAQIATLSFKELQTRLCDGSLSAEEVWKSYTAKALEVHGKTNAITDVIPTARAEAQALDEKTPSERGLLHGVPISVKECIGIQGMDCTAGLAALIGNLRTENSILIQVLQSHGAVPFIKTNLSQATVSIAPDNPIFGLTVNPLDQTRSPGGSSGGEGAIIGGGGSVLGIGSDIGGSIRLPATFCGIASLKPTNGRYSFRGSYRTGQAFDGESIVGNVEGPMAQEVHALVQFMRAALSPKMFELDPTIPPVPFREEVFRNQNRLRIGFYTYDGCTLCVPAVVRAINVAKEALESLGHTVVPFEPYEIFHGMREIFWPAVQADDFTSFYNLMKYDDTCDACFEPVRCNQWPYLVRHAMATVREFTTYDPVGNAGMKRKAIRTVKELWNLTIDRNDYRANFIKEWKGHDLDLVLCPVMACPAMTLGLDRLILAYVTYTSIYNLVNFPAGTVPVTRVTSQDVAQAKNPKYFKAETSFEKIIAKDSENSENLPLGVQIVGLPFQEEMVLRVMSELEGALKVKQQKQSI